MQEFQNIEQLLQSMTSNDDKYIVNYLKNRTQYLTLPMADGSDPLIRLEPVSVVYCMILSSRISTDSPEQLLNHAYTFATSFKRPISPEGVKELERLACALFALAESGKYGGKVSATLISLACRLALQDSRHYLTSIHSIALMAVLETEYLELSLNLINEPLTDLDSPNMKIDVKDFLLYQYYSGMIFMALKDFQSALIAFNYCLYTPGNAASAIQVEAFKKAILIGLLISGKLPVLPTQITSAVQKCLDTHCSSYTLFGDSFVNINYAQAKLLLEQNQQTWDSDGNLGLIILCCEAMVGRRISQLTKTYLTLSMSDIENILGPIALQFIAPISLESKISRMIADGEIFASIVKRENEAQTIVVFQDDVAQFDTNATSQLIVSEIDNVVRSNESINFLSRSISISPAFISATSKNTNDS